VDRIDENRAWLKPGVPLPGIARAQQAAAERQPDE